MKEQKDALLMLVVEASNPQINTVQYMRIC